jgi:hypothetical protein
MNTTGVRQESTREFGITAARLLRSETIFEASQSISCSIRHYEMHLKGRPSSSALFMLCHGGRKRKKHPAGMCVRPAPAQKRLRFPVGYTDAGSSRHLFGDSVWAFYDYLLFRYATSSKLANSTLGIRAAVTLSVAVAWSFALASPPSWCSGVSERSHSA